MPFKTKKSGAYADPVALKIKLSGVYQALAGIYAKAGGAYQNVVSGAPPTMVFRTYAEIPSAFVGYYTIPSGGRGNMAPGSIALRIKGSSASLYCFSGDASPYKVVVDSSDLSTAVIPTIVGGKIPLFTGLSDTWHTVLISPDNSSFGQGFAITGNMVEAYGSGAQITPLGQQWNTVDPTFPGVSTSLRTTQANYPVGLPLVTASSGGYAVRAPASIHCRAKFDELWVCIPYEPTHLMVSVNGALATACALSTGSNLQDSGAQWRKVTIPAQASYADLIITGGGGEGALLTNIAIYGISVVGSAASLIAPTGTRRHVCMMGASQVEGVVVGALGYRNDGVLVQNRLPVYVLPVGLAGSTIVTLTSQVANIAARLPVKDIALLSIGINSTDDASFQPDYQTLITTVLAAGFSKVICRGLVQAGGNASRNAKIAAAVAAIANPNVIYADVSTWAATADGAGGTIAMPDGSHPNAAGFATMADYWVRDHAALFS